MTEVAKITLKPLTPQGKETTLPYSKMTFTSKFVVVSNVIRLDARFNEKMQYNFECGYSNRDRAELSIDERTYIVKPVDDLFDNRKVLGKFRTQLTFEIIERLP